jgi:threonine dehydrogenase-like Zn-dependent dehydrogenase
MTDSMRALRLAAPLDAVITTVEVPTPGPGEVLIRARRTAISTGTELRQYRDERVAQNPAGFPRANGYSLVGTIEALGPATSGLAFGQRVFATAPHDELVVVPQDAVYPVPEGAADDEAVFAVIGEIGLHALRRGKPLFGENVAIIGQGVIGLATLSIARDWGLRTIALDLDARRREFARTVGADLVADPADPAHEAAIAAFCGDEGLDLVIEAASSWRAIGLAYRLVRRRGTVVAVARHTDIPDFNLIADDLMTKEVRFTTSYTHPVLDAPPDLLRWTRPRDLRLILELLGTGRLSFGALISHRIAPEELPTIYGRLHEGDTSIAGVVVEWA